MEDGLFIEKIFGKIINCDKWSYIEAVQLPFMVFSIKVFEKILSNNVLLESLILVGWKNMSKVGISLFSQPRIYIWLSWKNKIKV